MLSVLESNVFADLRRWTGAGEENLFTVALAHALARNPKALQRFVNWVGEECGVTLPDVATWSIRLEERHPHDTGNSYVDMLLRAPGIELWCEHKIDSVLTFEQAHNYLRAMARRMDVELPPSPSMPMSATGRPTVLLVIISHRRQDMTSLRPWRTSEPSSSGVLWASSADRGYLRWRDLRLQFVAKFRLLDPLLVSGGLTGALACSSQRRRG